MLYKSAYSSCSLFRLASKAGLSVYLESLRYRLHGTGVRVVTVKPGYVATPMTSGMKLPRPLATGSNACKGGKNADENSSADRHIQGLSEGGL